MDVELLVFLSRVVQSWSMRCRTEVRTVRAAGGRSGSTNEWWSGGARSELREGRCRDLLWAVNGQNVGDEVQDAEEVIVTYRLEVSRGCRLDLSRFCSVEPQDLAPLGIRNRPALAASLLAGHAIHTLLVVVHCKVPRQVFSWPLSFSLIAHPSDSSTRLHPRDCLYESTMTLARRRFPRN